MTSFGLGGASRGCDYGAEGSLGMSWVRTLVVSMNIGGNISGMDWSTIRGSTLKGQRLIQRGFLASYSPYIPNLSQMLE
jgi:hypothetical protein